MESQTFGHQHPLVFNQEVEIRFCSRCDEMLFGPGFSCSDSECEFSLHKECAEPPDYINHPLHSDHPLSLLPTAPYEGKAFICSFCGGKGENYVYHCSCGLALHIKCAFFTCNILEKNSGDFDYKEGFRIKNKCSVCWETILDSYYCCYRGWESLHKKCAELSFEIEYPLHHNRLLTLQFFVEKNPCVICHDTKRDGLCYACSLCNFSIHISCMSLPSVIQGNTNQHPFTLISRLMTFTCDACGVEGNTAPYMSNDRNLLVHKKCISLPPVIKFRWHEHLLFHSYFIDRYHSSSSKSNKNWDCVMCLDEVNTNHGSYFCSECHFILHVNCATEDERMYSVIESVEEFNKNRVLPKPSYRVVERNEGGEATKIKHFTHRHNLILLSEKIQTDQDHEFCDGCTLPILESYYSCSKKCKFFLHKKCVEFPKRKYLWFKECEAALSLAAGRVFKCFYCSSICNGFTYECPECFSDCCLRCVIHFTLTSEYEGHQHPLFFLTKHKGSCTNCCRKTRGAYVCKICKEIALCISCIRLPSKAQHRCDQHLLALTYKDDNTYSETHFCDICEGRRNPSPWFYSCATCDTCAHTDCVLQKGDSPFIKLGKLFLGEHLNLDKYGRIDEYMFAAKNVTWHPDPVRFVKKKYYYPKCFECDYPCQELALECTEPTCDYIVHWECICSSKLKELYYYH